MKVFPQKLLSCFSPVHVLYIESETKSSCLHLARVLGLDVSGIKRLLLCLCRKGQQLEPSEQYVLNRLEGGPSMLTIRNIRQGDGGTYSCRATNKAGSQERELFLKVFGKSPGRSRLNYIQSM